MYIIAPVNNGIRDTDDCYFISGVQISATECYCIMRDDAPIRGSWQVITEEEYHARVDSMLPWNVITVSVDKPTIAADGEDTATVTTNVPATTKLTEIDFIHSDTGQLISTQPVTNGTATLKVTATTPGTIRIRAGAGAGPENEVVINAA